MPDKNHCKKPKDCSKCNIKDIIYEMYNDVILLRKELKELKDEISEINDKLEDICNNGICS